MSVEEIPKGSDGRKCSACGKFIAADHKGVAFSFYPGGTLFWSHESCDSALAAFVKAEHP